VGECPLLAGGTCDLVARADAVVNDLPGPRGSAIRARLPAGVRAGPALGAVRQVSARSRALRLRFSLATRGGRRVTVRAIRPSDGDRLRRFDAGLSEKARRLRYLGYMPPMSGDGAARLASPDLDQRFAFVALAGRRLVGDCRLVPAEGGGEEIAIAVADDFQGAGVGRALLEVALRTAAERGFDEVVAEVNYENERMSRMLRRMGFQRTAWDLGVMTFRWSPIQLG
jgi:ribosomal protein S18 acetylase RimI-like enzyme